MPCYQVHRRTASWQIVALIYTGLMLASGQLYGTIPATVAIAAQLPDSIGGVFTMREGITSVTIQAKIIHNIVLVPVRINGSFALDFILDTGVSSTLLTEPAFASMLGLRYSGKVGLRGLGGGEPIKADIAQNVHLSLPDITAPRLNLVVLPPNVLSFSEMFGQPVYGIIGYDLFKSMVVEIDYISQKVHLYRPDVYRVRKKSVAVPLHIEKGKAHIAAQLADITGKHYAVNLLIDTGASQAISLFGTDIPLPPRHIETYIGKGLNGDVLGRLGKIGGLTIEAFELPTMAACYPDSAALSLRTSSVPWQGSIGGELLRRFKVVFDYPRQRLYLQKGRDYNKPYEYHLSGIEIQTLGVGNFDRFVVSHVQGSSTAEQSGIKVGDELLSINGTTLKMLTIEEVFGLLNRKTGATLRLKIRRDNDLFRFSWQLIDPL